jgi:hypothetical protein
MECSVMADSAISKKVNLGGGLSLQLTMSRSGAVCEWSPSMPSRLSRLQWKKYRKARDELITELGKRLGGDALVVEVQHESLQPTRSWIAVTASQRSRSPKP